MYRRHQYGDYDNNYYFYNDYYDDYHQPYKYRPTENNQYQYYTSVTPKTTPQVYPKTVYIPEQEIQFEPDDEDDIEEEEKLDE